MSPTAGLGFPQERVEIPCLELSTWFYKCAGRAPRVKIDARNVDGSIIIMGSSLKFAALCAVALFALQVPGQALTVAVGCKPTMATVNRA